MSRISYVLNVYLHIILSIYTCKNKNGLLIHGSLTFSWNRTTRKMYIASNKFEVFKLILSREIVVSCIIVYVYCTFCRYHPVKTKQNFHKVKVDSLSCVFDRVFVYARLKNETYYIITRAGGRAGTHWFPLNNLSSSERINSKLHGKVHYHDSLDKFDNQNYSRLFKRVIAL